MSQAGLDRLMAIDYILKLQTEMKFCDHCRYEKQTRSPHSLKYEMVQQPLEPVHTNICGSMPKRSRGGSWYFITFVDDCTTKVWAYSINSKDEVYAHIPRERGKKVIPPSEKMHLSWLWDEPQFRLSALGPRAQKANPKQRRNL